MKKEIFLLLLPLIFMSNFGISRAQEQNGLTTDELTTIGIKVVELLSKEDFKSVVNYFDDTMKKAASPKKLKAIWKSLLKNNGPLKGQIGVRTGKEQGYDILFVRCEFEKSKLDLKIVFNSAKQVAGLFFVPLLTN